MIKRLRAKVMIVGQMEEVPINYAQGCDFQVNICSLGDFYYDGSDLRCNNK